jgi:hypothetical protein
MLVFRKFDEDDETGEDVVLNGDLPISFNAGLYSTPLSGTDDFSSIN